MSLRLAGGLLVGFATIAGTVFAGLSYFDQQSKGAKAAMVVTSSEPEAPPRTHNTPSTPPPQATPPPAEPPAKKTVTLDLAAPGETWRVASLDEIRWLVGSWCLPEVGRGAEGRLTLSAEGDQLVYRWTYKAGVYDYPDDAFDSGDIPTEIFTNGRLAHVRPTNGKDSFFAENTDAPYGFRHFTRRFDDLGQLEVKASSTIYDCSKCRVVEKNLMREMSCD